MTINELYTISDENNIDVYHFILNNAKSLSMPGNIAINIDNVESIAEEKVLLAHELGHCIKYAFYNSDNIADLWERHEYKADKWAVQKLVPFDELMSAVEKGITQAWELAEYFNVTEEFIQRAIYIYQRIEKIKLI